MRGTYLEVYEFHKVICALFGRLNICAYVFLVKVQFRSTGVDIIEDLDEVPGYMKMIRW